MALNRVPPGAGYWAGDGARECGGREPGEDAAPNFHLELKSIRAVGANQVLRFFEVIASGRASGLPAGTPTANVQQALEAVGLRE